MAIPSEPSTRQGDNSAIPAARGPPVAQSQAIRQHQQRKEGDLIIGKGGRTAVATLVERVTRMTIHVKVSTRRSADVVAAIAQRMRDWHVISITWDKGKEMAEHHELARQLRIDVYFAEEHSPWQRGSNENSNGVSRRHMPKGTELDRTPAQLRSIPQLMNDRPMAVLLLQSPKDAYAAHMANMR